MATTPNGVPYVLPADHPLEYPTVSQQLANKVDTLFAGDLWTAWTPTLIGFTAQSVTARYRRTPGGLCTVQARFAVQAVTGTPGFSVPVIPTADAPGSGFAHDVGSLRYPLTLLVTSGDPNVYVYCHKTDVAHATLAGFTATVPFTWAPGDLIVVAADFQVAPTTP